MRFKFFTKQFIIHSVKMLGKKIKTFEEYAPLQQVSLIALMFSHHVSPT